MNKIFSIVILSLLLASCNTTEQATEIDRKSGFLKDYSSLNTGEDGHALLVYKKENTDFKKYKKIMIDPVQLWTTKESDLKKLDRVKLEKILSFLNTTIIHALKGDFEIVKNPGPDTFRLRIALTEGEASQMERDLVSTILPIGLAISYLKKAAGGQHTAVGKATVEAELVDSVSGVRHLAGIDSRYGGKGLKGKFDNWDDVKSSFEYWSSKINKKLVELTK